MNLQRRASLVVLVVLLIAVVPALANETTTSVDQFPVFKDWSTVYDDLNGDRSITIPLASSRILVTERVPFSGTARVDLIGGTAEIEIANLDRTVDVWLLDNKPGENKSILPEAGDVLIRLGRVSPAKDGMARTSADLGPDAFRGVEIDWVLVSDAGADPSESRLLYGSRPYFEKLYTQKRLEREGFFEDRHSIPLKQRPVDTRGFDTKATSMPLTPMVAPPIIATTPHKVLVTSGLVSEEIFKGGLVFFEETFEGNGRSCGTCHPAENNQTIEPKFISTLPANDPLFVAEQRPPSDPISDLERPELMRYFGLILENVDGLEDPNVKFLMRSVPHSLSLATSIRATDPTTTPKEHTGWSSDGAPNMGFLSDFLLGAIIQHYPNNSLARVFKEDVPPGYPFDFRMPTDVELKLTNEFMLNVGRLNELNLTPGAFNSVTPSEPRAEAGRARFVGSACNGCHNNASANVGPNATGPNNNFNTQVERRPNPAQGFMGISFPGDGGFGGQGLNAPNFDCDGDGINDCFGNGQFNNVPLVEAADTGPFFHTNVELTIEDAVNFYNGPEFPVVNFSTTDVEDVGAFLRVINAAFNLQMAMQRNKAAATIDPTPAPSITDFIGIRGTANKLLLLAIDEINDAIDVLAGSPIGVLNPSAVENAKEARQKLHRAVNSNSLGSRRDLMEKAQFLLTQGNQSLGRGMSYRLGSGNLMFGDEMP